MAEYALGNIDRFFIAANGTVMEVNPFFHAVIDEKVDGKRLLNAVETALCHHPLFKTRVRYKKQYYLETNDRPVLITQSEPAQRPKEFGVSTNDYPWRICYHEQTICFEWCHAITDGRGAIHFFGDMLSAYYDIDLGDIPEQFPLETGFEHFYDETVKPFGQVKQEKGFKAKSFPHIKNGFKCTSHIISIQTSQLLAVAKTVDATPATIIAPLLSKAIRSCIPENVKNRNVSCGISVDCRKPMDFQTMHNFILNKVITYTDRMDNFDFATLCTVYRTILDLFIQRENIVAGCTDMIKQYDLLFRLRPLWLQRVILKLVAKIIKNDMNSFGLTYLGQVPFDDRVCERLVSFGGRCWPDMGNCVAALVDLKGVLYIDICENYRNKNVVPSLIKICHDYGIDVKLERTEEFEQAAMIVK